MTYNAKREQNRREWNESIDSAKQEVEKMVRDRRPEKVTGKREPWVPVPCSSKTYVG